MINEFWITIIFASIFSASLWAFGRWVLPRIHGKGNVEDRLEALQAMCGEWESKWQDSEKIIKRHEDRQEFLLNQLERCNVQIAEQKVEIQKLKTKVEDFERRLQKENAIQPIPLLPLLVAIGNDAALKLDLASLRAVETDTGMEFRRIEDATLDKIKRYLDRARINGRPVDKLHLAVHSGPDGIYLSGDIINSEQLSEILRDVRIMLIAGCESDAVADFLGVVPYVVSMTEKVSHTDAALFCRAFWEEIGRRREPTEALRNALKRSPSGMSEMIEFHW